MARLYKRDSINSDAVHQSLLAEIQSSLLVKAALDKKQLWR